MSLESIVVGVVLAVLGGVGDGEVGRGGLSEGLFEKALRNISTGPNYVLVRIVDKSKKDGGSELVCLEATTLVMRLEGEHGFTKEDGPFEQAIRFALEQKDRTYEFSERAPKRRYTDAMLKEVRRFLAGKDEADIRALAGDQQSALYERCSKKPGDLPRYFPAIGHVLCERGILCGPSCKPGLIFVEERKRKE